MTPRKFVGRLLVFSGILLLLVLLMQPLSIYKFREFISVLFPAGKIGIEERTLLFIIQGLMLLVIFPVYIMTFFFSWKYRADNPKHDYDPDLVDSVQAEVIWWGLPFVITVIIAVFTTYATYRLDPFTPIASQKKPITIQVVALQWRWLFIYPEEKIASMNFLQIPKDTPIHFEITADAPMNSFWIPRLGGQIYAMPKMKTELHLIADEEGDFRGSSAHISGVGFSGMHFITKASSDEAYKNWIQSAQKSKLHLDFKTYETLAKPSENSSVQLYSLEDENLFEAILNKYMHRQKK